MTDVYKLIANMICNSINGKWDKAIVEIESSLGRMLSTNAYYFYNNEEKHAFELIEDNQSEDLGENVFALQESMSPEELIEDNQSEDLGENVFALQASMSPEHKWNKAVYTLEKNGHFDMTFEWDQALQDEWDKCIGLNTKITGTNTYIDVELDGRTVRILGEMIVGGFVCYKSSMKNWLIPENEPLTEGDKKEIIQKVTEKTVGSHMVITFE